MSDDGSLDRGLPTNVDAERFVLGSILLDDSLFPGVAATLEADAFSLNKHKLIFKRMIRLQENGTRIDRVTVADELMKLNQLEACDGLSYIISLDDGLPHIPNVDSYVKIVQDKAALRRIIFACQNGMQRAFLAEEDPNEIISGVEETLLKLSDHGAEKGPSTPYEIVEQCEGGIEAFMDPTKRTKGVYCGYPKFDDMTYGLRPGDLFIVAARPSVGKTAFALNVAQHVAVTKKEPVTIFSLEMSKESLLSRMLCSLARVDGHRFRHGYLTQDERNKLNKALHELIDSPLLIDDSTTVSLMEIDSKLRRIEKHTKQKPRLVIVDYLQLMHAPKRQNRNDEVSALSRGLKLIGKDRGVPMMVLSQLSRAVETRTGDHRPRLADLRDSGAIEQDADLVGFLHRPEMYYPDREDFKGLAELILSKQRNGPVGTVNLVWLAGPTRFESAADDFDAHQESD